MKLPLLLVFLLLLVDLAAFDPSLFSDFETDSWIQNTIRRGLPGTTLFIVAHRLQTVIDVDRIMVLDAGNLIEFGSPKELLAKEGGYFRSLVKMSFSI